MLPNPATSRSPLPVLYTDVQLTRRKYAHVLTDSTGTILWSGRWTADLLEYCAEAGLPEIIVKCEENRYILELAILPNEHGDENE